MKNHFQIHKTLEDGFNLKDILIASIPPSDIPDDKTSSSSVGVG